MNNFWKTTAAALLLGLITLTLTSAILKSSDESLVKVKLFKAMTSVELTWRMLSDVDFKDVYIEELDAYYWKPTFGETLKVMEGKKVYITGYVIPADADENYYFLSRYPFANCFFCGGAGPESVVDLRITDTKRTFMTDERITFEGKLRLNADDIYEMNYILEGAVVKD